MDPFELLEKRVSRLGNHHQKYLHTIYRFKDSLIEALESSGNIMQVPLWRSSFSPAEDMKIIANLFEESRKKIHHISCYYALQFLHMNFRNLDILELGIASGSPLPEDYHNFMMQMGKDFRELTGVYLSSLIDIYLPKDKQPEFFVCSVGTRADQDDIDIGVIAANEADRQALEEVFRKIAQDMLVYATPLHMYLSEHVGDQYYTTTTTQYKTLLSRQFQDIVIVSELLNAKWILGSEKLFKTFQKEVVYKYFYYRRRDMRYHEGFLRGILGEARALLIKPLNTEAISPKDDALRILKSIIYAKKAILRIEDVNAWDILQKLMQFEPDYSPQYELIFKATSFLETFKFLLQLFVIQEDTFRLDEIDEKQLTLIAARMGYEAVGTVRAWDQLIIDYYRYVREVRRVCDQLIDSISHHLSDVSIFIKLLSKSRWDAKGDYKGSMPKDFIHVARFFEGTKYWDDLLTLLQTEKKIIDAFISGFQMLDSVQKRRTIKRYIEWANFSPLTIIRLITILFKYQETRLGIKIAEEMNLAFLNYFTDMPLITTRFCLIYSYYPQYVHDYLQYFPESHFDLFDKILSQQVHDDKIREYQHQLRELCKIHKWSSQYFHRFFYRVILHHPEYLKAITNPNQLAKISTGLLAMVDRFPETPQKKRYLADYYDLEFLRVGIGTINGVDMNETNREYTEFCDTYMKKLFDICSEEIERERKGDAEVPSTDKLAILAAGGHGRGKAYDDDYDLIVITNTDEPPVIQHATRIIARMNREILKRGVLPHYRLGEILEGFVNPVSKITAYLETENVDSFIDLSQLLGARIIIGSDLMRSAIYQHILDRFIFSDKERYIERMIGEIKSRQASAENCEADSCNIKETRGGLRDIEAVSLMLKAYLGITDPIVKDFFREIKVYLPDLAVEIENLNHCLHILRTFRDLYRLTVAAEDNFNADYFGRLAAIFEQHQHPEWHDKEVIKLKILETLRLSQKACNAIIKYLQQHIN